MASTNSPDAFSVDKDAATSSATPLAVVRFAILSFWVVVIFLGLPIWLKTTAIYRAELPLQEMTAWAEGRVRPTFLNDV
jgi:phosphatidylinositol glycan class S